MEASQLTIELRRDQVFGLYAQLEPALATALADYFDDCCAPFVLALAGAARLDRAGRTTVIFPGRLADVCEHLVEYGARVVTPAVDADPENRRYLAPVDRLLTLGDAGEWTGGAEAAVLPEFSSADIPALIRMATDDELHGAPSVSEAVWAPVHAMRALGQLQAKEAIEPLLAQLRRIDENEDDYLGVAVPESLAAIGPSALAPSAAYLADERKGPHARLAAAKALRLLGARISEARAECVHCITSQLLSHAVQQPFFNAVLIAGLLELRAVESAAVIERAFTNERVDESVCGDWEDVQIEFGLKLRRERPRRPNEWSEKARELRDAMGMPEIDEMAEPMGASLSAPVPLRAAPKIGRNEPCPCGSGKKYKKCCGG